MTQKLKVKKGDEVVVLAGRDKGKKGSILRVIPAENRVVVSGINVVKRHKKADRAQGGGIISMELPIHVSNVALTDPKSGEATRIGYKTLEDGRKVRVAKRSGEVING